MEKINCSKRQLSFDALKLITIFLVIWGHCVQHLLSSDYYEDTVYVVIYSFHMPLFFFIYPMGYIPYLAVAACCIIAISMACPRKQIKNTQFSWL